MKIETEQFHQTDQGRLELKRGGGCVGCFAVPFFLSGVFFLLVGLLIIPLSSASGIPWWGWILLVAMGLIFSIIGVALVFGRSWLTLDIISGRIWVAWGLLKPMRVRSYFLKDYDRIVKYFNPGDSKTAPSYTLVLKSLTGSELKLLNSNDFDIAHNQALLLMNFLNLPLDDNSSVHPVTIKPGIFPTEGLKLREIKNVAKPELLRSEIWTHENELHIKIPADRFSLFSLLGFFFPVIIAQIFMANLLMFFRGNHAPLAVKMVFIGFIALFFILIPALSVLKKFISSHGIAMEVTVDKTGIVILQKRQSKTISRESILSLDYGTTKTVFEAIASSRNGQANASISPPLASSLQRFARSKGVIVKSREGETYIGAGLPDAEVMYLYSLISRYFM